jgi:hypothetical protein
MTTTPEQERIFVATLRTAAAVRLTAREQALASFNPTDPLNFSLYVATPYQVLIRRSRRPCSRPQTLRASRLPRRGDDMTTFAAEQTFRNAVAAAEAVRQNSVAAAFAAYNFVAANYATYQTSLAAAQNVYAVSVAAAASTAALDPELGRTPIPTNWAKIAGN